MKIFISVFVTLLFVTSSAFSCRCVFSNSIKEEAANHSLIFKGIPISSDTIATFLRSNNNDTFYYTKIRFRFVISSYFKGKINSDTVSIVTGFGGGDCGFPFKIGETYIIFAQEQLIDEVDLGLLKQYGGRMIPNPTVLKNTYYHTNICSWTTPFTNEKGLYIQKQLIKLMNGS